MSNRKTIIKIAALLACAFTTSAQALVINFTHAADMDARALAGFEAAGARWSAVLHDNVAVNLNIGFTKLSPGVLGSTGSTRGLYSYDTFRNALIADAWGATDEAVVANLPKSSCLSVMMNGTNVNPAGVGSGATFIDNNCNANNSSIRMTSANARALGLLGANNPLTDGAISFSNTFNWDFDPTDGVNGDAFDFVGVATHEIGHALGFISGVDIVDGNRSGNFSDALFTYIAPNDLFRCSADSKAQGADLDFSADTRTKYFSLDNCNTVLATFSTGTTYGDGRQASHWKDNLGIGIMDPTAGYGEKLSISDMDLKMFDAIGWNTVPEPGTVTLLGFGLVGMFGLRRRKK